MASLQKLLTSQLNRLPEGLLDFFSIKSMGEYPQSMSQELRGILDLTRWYSDIRADEGRAVLAPVAVANANANDINISSAFWAVSGGFDFAQFTPGGLTTIVPQQEVWVLLESTCLWSITATAGIAAQASFVTTRYVDGSCLLCTDGLVQGWTDGIAGVARQGQRCQTRSPLFLLPGCEFRYRHFGLTVPAGQVDGQLSVRIVRLKR